MCYAFKQISYWYIYDFLVDILFLVLQLFRVYIPLCRYIYHHDFIYLEPYTLERNYISS